MERDKKLAQILEAYSETRSPRNDIQFLATVLDIVGYPHGATSENVRKFMLAKGWVEVSSSVKTRYTRFEHPTEKIADGTPCYYHFPSTIRAEHWTEKDNGSEKSLCIMWWDTMRSYHSDLTLSEYHKIVHGSTGAFTTTNTNNEPIHFNLDLSGFGLPVFLVWETNKPETVQVYPATTNNQKFGKYTFFLEYKKDLFNPNITNYSCRDREGSTAIADGLIRVTLVHIPCSAKQKIAVYTNGTEAFTTTNLNNESYPFQP